MKQQKLLQQSLSLGLILAFLVGCSSASATPTLTPIPSTATTTPIPPTTTPTETSTPTLEPTLTFTPIPATPKAGHWEGEPSVSFVVSSDGQIHNFVMVAQLDPAKTCTVKADSIAVEADSTFVFSAFAPLSSLGKNVVTMMSALGIPTPTPVTTDLGEGMFEAQRLSGKFETNTTLAGTYKVLACFNESEVFYSASEEFPTWSAEWNRP